MFLWLYRWGFRIDCPWWCIGGPGGLASVASGVGRRALFWSTLTRGVSQLAPGAVSNHSFNFIVYGRYDPSTDVIVHVKLTKEVWASDRYSAVVASTYFTVSKVIRRFFDLSRCEDGRCCDGERRLSCSRLGERMFMSLTGVLLLEDWRL